MHNTSAFRCDYCYALYPTADSCSKHEEKCHKNPNAMALCFRCKHFVTVATLDAIDDDGAKQPGAKYEFSYHKCLAARTGPYLLFRSRLPKRIAKKLVMTGRFKPMPNNLNGGCELYTSTR